MINKIYGYTNNLKQNKINHQMSFGTAYDSAGRILTAAKEQSAISTLILNVTNPKKPFLFEGCNLPELTYNFTGKINRKISRIIIKPATKKSPMEINANIKGKFTKIVQDYNLDEKQDPDKLTINTMLNSNFNTLVIILERLLKK